MGRTLLAALATGLLMAATACVSGLEPPNGAGGTNGGKSHPRPDGTGGSGSNGGSGGGAAGSGGAGGAGGDAPAPLRLDELRPARGLQAGGATITLVGSGFLQDFGRKASALTEVRFGSNPVLGVRVIDDQTIYATVPPGAAGPADVTVTNPYGETRCEGCFRYLDPLRIEALEPAEGTVHGGTRIRLRGTSLREGMILTIGGRAALDLALDEDGSLLATTPPGDEEGLVDVRLFDEDGHDWMRKSFRYTAPLRIFAVDPPGGPLPGGNRVRLKGTGFSAAAAAFVDGVAVHSLYEAGGTLLVTMPAKPATGVATLEVRRSGETASAQYAYFDPAATDLRLLSFSPSRSGLDGGDEAVLVGTGLDHPRLAVWIGGRLAEVEGRAGSFFATVRIPAASAAGLADVEARTDESAGTLEAALRYVKPFVVSSVAPGTAPLEGGVEVAITGRDFPAAVRVFVGALEASDVRRESATRLRAIVPRGTDGRVPVRVVDADDEANEALLADAFLYVGTPRLALVDPPTGARAGGTRVTLRGAGFDRSLTATFGDARATLESVLDPFTSIWVTPRGNAGLVDVGVSGPGGSSTIRDGFSYTSSSSTTGGSSGGPLDGNLNVSVIEATWWKFGQPIAGATVTVGENATTLRGVTDDRGEVTFSSPLLIKPQVVTVVLEGYESATVVNQQSENLTIRLQDLGPSDPDLPIFPEMPEPGFVQGRLWGFKRPPNRPLRAGEREAAYVSVAPRSVYSLPPFGWQPSSIEILADGGAFRFGFRGGRQVTLFAIYGIENQIDRSFEPLVMGVTRGVQTLPEVTTEADVILDTHMNVTAPVTILNPPVLDGFETSTRVYAYADLGGEGVIPLDVARTGNASGAKATFTKLPSLEGANLLFAARGGMGDEQMEPYSVTFRRQLGDPRQGVDVGPLLGLTRFVSPSGRLGSTIEWTRGPGPTPDLSYVFIEDPLTWRPLWHIVVPGGDVRVAVPDAVRDLLRRQFSSEDELLLTLV
ncbi:MAG TPA: IPT/TIG domain-containing protein, partial [Vulgatibacter sp.]